jgi:hypothetical protein
VELVQDPSAPWEASAPAVVDVSQGRPVDLAAEACALALGQAGGRLVRGVWTVRLDLAHDAVAVARALLLRVWQTCGLAGRAAVAAFEGDASALVRVLGAGQVGVVPVEASGVWAGGRGLRRGRARLGAREGVWEGRVMEDADGVAARAAVLARGVTSRCLRVRLAGPSGQEAAELRIELPRHADVAVRRALVEDAVRRHALACGPVRGIRVRAWRATSRVAASARAARAA